MLEAIVIHFLYEIMREAGLRVPQPLSNAVSIVGALVIGETAVTSGLVGAPTLMVIALTATASYVTPNLYGPVTIMRFIFIIVGGTLGFWGLALCLMVLLVNICAEMVYRIPYSAPISPFHLRSMRDVLIRASWRVLARDVEMVQNMPGSEIKNSDQKGKQL
jgi:spore germination protein KA